MDLTLQHAQIRPHDALPTPRPATPSPSAAAPSPSALSPSSRPSESTISENGPGHGYTVRDPLLNPGFIVLTCLPDTEESPLLINLTLILRCTNNMLRIPLSMELPLHCILLNKIFLKHDIRFDLAKRRAVREDFHVPFADTNEENSRVETAAVVAADNVNVRDEFEAGRNMLQGMLTFIIAVHASNQLKSQLGLKSQNDRSYLRYPRRTIILLPSHLRELEQKYI
ncbi:MAG: hypothetical protein Q9175_002890 [Cornicularia normoerica]